jgi:hypothetical protein
MMEHRAAVASSRVADWIFFWSSLVYILSSTQPLRPFYYRRESFPMLSMVRKIWAGRRDSAAAVSLRTTTFIVRDSPPQYVTDIPQGNIFGGSSVTAEAAIAGEGNSTSGQRRKNNVVELAPRPARALEGKSLTSSKLQR